jgi:predicted Zn-dependent peptidase
MWTSSEERKRRSSNAVMAAVGDFEAGEIMELIRSAFASLPAGEVPVRSIPKEPEQEGERRAVLRMDARPELIMGFHKPTLPSREDYVFDLIDGLLAGGRTSRLHRELVEERQIAVSVGTANGYPGARYPNLFVIRAVPRYPHDNAQVERAILEEIDLLIRQGAGEKELRRVKSRMKADLLRGLQSNQGLAALLSYYQAVGGDWRYAATHLDVLEGITPTEIQETAARFLTARNRTVVVLETDEGENGP